ncbi:YggS family pyridoxal phosphate-dependent enzyme [Candidatus Omnitrophota bacterium]
MIKENLTRLLAQIPAGVRIVAAGKSRSAAEIQEAIQAGISVIGENYVREAEDKFSVIGRDVEWHFIGHLQKNKVKKAAGIFDMIQSVDSPAIAEEIDRACRLKNRIMQVLIEINCAREKGKFGFFPEEVESMIIQASRLEYIKILGLMTMGPNLADQEGLRPYFMQMQELFERIKSRNLPGVEMRYLSMGMSDSYQVAIEEGANMVRIGTAIFGRRK